MNLTRAVLQFHETGLAHDPLGHHAPGYADFDFLLGECVIVVRMESLVQFPGRRVAAKIIRERVTLLTKRIELAATFGDEFVLVGFVLVVCHVSFIPYSPCFRLASIKSSRLPSSTA